MEIDFTFRGLSRSGSLMEHIERLAEHLPVQSCRVVVEIPKRRCIRVRVELAAPRLVAESESDDAFVAAREAFDAARRQFGDWAERRRALRPQPTD